MFKITTLVVLLLFVVSSLSAPEEKRARLYYCEKSSDYENPNVEYPLAPKLYDDNLNNMEATTNQDPEPYFICNTNYNPFYVTYVEVYNRADCCQNRISPFTVFVSNGTENWGNNTVAYYKTSGEYSNWRDVSGVQAIYRVPFPNVRLRFFRIQQHTKDFANIAEISLVQLYRPPYTGAASSSVYDAINNPITQAYDSRPNTWFATNSDTYPWIEVYFPAQKICRVTIWNRWESCCSSRIDPFTVALKSGNFTVRTGTPAVSLVQNYCSNEAGITCSTTQTGTQEFYDVDFSTEPLADRVRIFQHNAGFLNIGEVQVYACKFPTDFRYDSV